MNKLIYSQVVTLALICPILVCANPRPGGRHGKKLPMFRDYPVSEVWRGKAAAVKLTTRSERMFRTQLTEAAKSNPDFAGHYKFAGWGCGSACGAGAIIDLKTGRVYPPPFGGKRSGWEYWIFTGGVFTEKYVEYQPDSRLMIVRHFENHDHFPDLYYFVWKGNSFRLIRRFAAAGSSQVISPRIRWPGQNAGGNNLRNSGRDRR